MMMIKPEVIGHGCAAWPATVDLNVFHMYLEGLSAPTCTAAHLRSLSEAHHLPNTFFAPKASAASVSSPTEPSKNAVGAFSAAGFTEEELQCLNRLPLPTAEYLLVLRADPHQLTSALDEQLQFFRTLERDEGYFEEPSTFLALHALPVHPIVRKALVERYYSLEDNVLAACFGRRLGKNDCEEIVEQFSESGYPEQWVRRQVECVRRVHKVIVAGYRKKPSGVERAGRFEMHYSCTEAIMELYKVTTEQSRTYAALVFASEHLIHDVPFSSLSLAHRLLLCEAAMEAWCGPNQIWISGTFRTSMHHLSRLLNDLAIQRDLIHVLGSAATGPMALALKIFPPTLTAAPTATVAIPAATGTHPSPQPATSVTGTRTSTPAIAGQTAGGAATASHVPPLEDSRSMVDPKGSPPPPVSPAVPNRELSTTFTPASAAGTASSGARWRYGTWLEGELLALCRALSRVARTLATKDEASHAFAAAYSQVYDPYVIHPEGGHLAVALLGRVGECVTALKATPIDIHGDVLRFFVVIKLMCQLLLATQRPGG
jgi:hypothetical protein